MSDRDLLVTCSIIEAYHTDTVPFSEVVPLIAGIRERDAEIGRLRRMADQLAICLSQHLPSDFPSLRKQRDEAMNAWREVAKEIA